MEQAIRKEIEPRHLPWREEAIRNRAPRRAGIAWSAILGGTITIMAVLVVLGAVGVGWLLSGRLLEFVAAWPLVSMLLAGAGLALVFLFGGWIAGHFAGPRTRLDRALHGLGVWAVVTVLGASIGTIAIARTLQSAAELLAGTAGGAERLATGLMQAAAPVLVAGLSGADVPVPVDAIRSEGRDLARQVVTRPSATLDKLGEALESIDSLLTEVPPAAPTAVRPGLPGSLVGDAALIELIAQQTGVPPARAVEGLIDWQTVPPASLYDQLRAALLSVAEDLRLQLVQMLETTAELASVTLLLAGAGLGVTALAAAIGGAVAESGKPKQAER